MKTKSIKCEFRNSRNLTLDAKLDLPGNYNGHQALQYIIFCHCFTCSKETITSYRISRLLAAHGFAVLRFDFTGLGKSEGDFSTTNFSTARDDLRSAINYIEQNHGAVSYLMGHSLGGTTALSIVQDYENIRATVCIASPAKPDHVLHHFGHALILLEQGITASFEVAGQYFEIAPGFVEDVRNFDMRSRLSQLDKPVLLINIENDALVDETNAREIQQQTKGEATLITVKNTDHLLSDRQSSQDVANKIIEWLQKN